MQIENNLSNKKTSIECLDIVNLIKGEKFVKKNKAKFDKIRQFLYILRNLRIFLVRTLVRFYDRLLWKIIPDRSCNLIVLIYKVYITFKLLRG